MRQGGDAAVLHRLRRNPLPLHSRRTTEQIDAGLARGILDR